MPVESAITSAKIRGVQPIRQPLIVDGVRLSSLGSPRSYWQGRGLPINAPGLVDAPRLQNGLTRQSTVTCRIQVLRMFSRSSKSNLSR
jgi:hypothetical protein